MVDSQNFAWIKKGNEFRQQGDAKRKGSFFGNMMTSKQDRDQEAKELYQQASNCYKTANDRDSAVECLMLCIDCETQDSIKADHLSEAAKIIKTVNSDKYVQFITQAIQYYSIAGRTSKAASLARDAAEKAEEDFNYEAATKLFEQAANYYDLDNQALQANNMLVKWADLTIVSAPSSGKNVFDFAKLIKTYDKVGFKQLSQGLAKAMAKDYFFKSALCYLANEDLVGCKRALENYNMEDPSFETDRKMKFLKSLLGACEMTDSELFAKTVGEYQRITPLDKVCTKLVVKAKMRYCPEQETAISSITKEVNLVDQDSDEEQFKAKATKSDDYDFT